RRGPLPCRRRLLPRARAPLARRCRFPCRARLSSRRGPARRRRTRAARDRAPQRRRAVLLMLVVVRHRHFVEVRHDAPRGREMELRATCPFAALRKLTTPENGGVVPPISGCAG